MSKTRKKNRKSTLALAAVLGAVTPVVAPAVSTYFTGKSVFSDNIVYADLAYSYELLGTYYSGGRRPDYENFELNGTIEEDGILYLSRLLNTTNDSQAVVDIIVERTSQGKVDSYHIEGRQLGRVHTIGSIIITNNTIS